EKDEIRGGGEGDGWDVGIGRGADCRGPHVLVGNRYCPRRRQMQAAFDELRVARAARGEVGKDAVECPAEGNSAWNDRDTALGLAKPTGRTAKSGKGHVPGRKLVQPGVVSCTLRIVSLDPELVPLVPGNIQHEAAADGPAELVTRRDAGKARVRYQKVVAIEARTHLMRGPHELCGTPGLLDV